VGSLFDGGVSDYIRCGGQLTPAAGTLTGGRSLISKAGTEVEIARL
jgi:hypothetical protein